MELTRNGVASIGVVGVLSFVDIAASAQPLLIRIQKVYLVSSILSSPLSFLLQSSMIILDHVPTMIDRRSPEGRHVLDPLLLACVSEDL